MNKSKVLIMAAIGTALIVIVLSIFLGILKSNSKNNNPSSLYNDVNNEFGNSDVNVNNGGYAAKRGQWLYYSVPGFGLFKENCSGGKTIKIANDSATNINVVGNWIYYKKLNDSKNQLYKNQLNGDGKSPINNISTGSFLVVKDWIYFSNYSDNLKLYKVHVNGTQLGKLSDEKAWNICFNNNWIYYLNYSQYPYNIYRIKTNGTEKTKLSNDNAFNLTVVNDWIYYIDLGNEGEINSVCKMYIDGTQKMKLFDSAGFINVVNDWIYYTNTSDRNFIYKVRTDITGNEKLLNDEAIGLVISGNWIYYRHFDSSEVFRVSTDGKKAQYYNSGWLSKSN